MVAKPLDIRTQPYFSGAIFYFGIGLILPGLFLVKIHPLAMVPFFLMSLITLTTHYGLEVDEQRKRYCEYVWLLGIKLGEGKIFDRMEYIFIKRNKESQTIHSRINSREVRYEVYDGYLRFSEANKVHIASARNKETLIQSLKPLAKQLHLEIMDYPEGSLTIIAPA